MKLFRLHIIKNGQKGYTLLFAVLTAALVLGIGAFILGIARKQYIISASARDSIYALYAADTGIECAVEAKAFSWVSDSSYSVPCANNDGQPHGGGLIEDVKSITFPSTPMTDNTDAPVELDHTRDIFESNEIQYILRDINELNDPNIAPDDSIIGCLNIRAWVGTDREDANVPRTVVESRGYNLCDPSTGGPVSGARTVERAVRVIQ